MTDAARLTALRAILQACRQPAPAHDPANTVIEQILQLVEQQHARKECHPQREGFVETRCRPELADLTDAYLELSRAKTDMLRATGALSYMYRQRDKHPRQQNEEARRLLIAGHCRVQEANQRMHPAVSKMTDILSRYAQQQELQRAGWDRWQIAAEMINVDCAMSLLENVLHSCYPMITSFTEDLSEVSETFERCRSQISFPAPCAITDANGAQRADVFMRSGGFQIQLRERAVGSAEDTPRVAIAWLKRDDCRD